MRQRRKQTGGTVCGVGGGLFTGVHFEFLKVGRKTEIRDSECGFPLTFTYNLLLKMGNKQAGNCKTAAHFHRFI